MDADKYTFFCEHYEEHSQMTKEYLITFYVKRGGGPNELSIYDPKNKRVFLKKGVYDQDGPVRLEDMYINGTVTICSRKMKVISYADAGTRALFEKNCEVVCASVGAAAFNDLGAILSNAAQAGYQLKQIKTVAAPQSDAPAVALEMVGKEAVQNFLQLARSATRAPEAVTIEGSDYIEKIFGNRQTTATFDSCSICIIRPHAVREGLTGIVLSTLIENGLSISALQTHSLLKSQSENFYEVYKTVLPSAQYAAMVGELSSGICVAVEVRAQSDAVLRLRELCGPYDVEIARHLRPNTIRARLGRDNVQNAVHCTDLPEDGVLESQYFFSILINA